MPDLDLLLINPGGSRKRVYQELSRGISAIEPPFQVASTAGFIRDRGYGVGILDANAENLDHAETSKEVEDRDPSLVNIIVYGQQPSASTQLMTSVGELCNEIKRNNPERRILLTGLHPSSLPRRTLEEEACDYVGEGEGYLTVRALLNSSNLTEVPGLWYREGGEILSNARAPNIQDLTSETGSVAWDLLPFEKKPYRAHNWQALGRPESRRDYASLSTSVGCPFTCDFCSIWQTFGEHAIRYWDPAWVVDQVEHLVGEKGIKIFKIIDEMFILNPSHYTGIADQLIERGLGNEISIWSYVRVDTVLDKHLDKMKKAGFDWMCPGFESGNEEIIREIQKGKYGYQDMIDARNKLGDAGINVIGNYMFGFNQDTRETMQQTLDLAIEHNCEFVNFYCAVPWPGSNLYNNSMADKIRMPETWADYSQHAYGFIPLSSEHLSPEEILEFRDEAFHKYFSGSEYLNMIEDKFGRPAKAEIEEMAKTRLRRKILE